LPGIVAGVFMVVALSEELEERKAALPARKGMSAVAGLARRAIEAAYRVVENMIATDTREGREGRSGEARCGVAVEESRSCVDEVGAAKCLAEID